MSLPVESRQGWLRACQFATLAVGAWAYAPTLRRTVAAWTASPDYSHGFFVVPIAAWLWWQRRPGAAPSQAGAGRALLPSAWRPGDMWGGAALLVVAGMARIVAARFYLPEVDAWSIPLWLAGWTWAFCGRNVFRLALTPIAFLWFATPLPASLELALSTPLQRASAQVSGFVLQSLGRPALVEGTTIVLNEHVLDVERACSGLRIFYGVLALAVACVALVRLPRWQAAVVLLAAVPAAIIANVTRIVATGALYEYASSEWAIRFSHDLAGLVTIPLAAGLFALLCHALAAIDRRVQSPQTARWGRLAIGGTACAVVVGVVGWWSAQQRQHVFDALRARADQLASQGEWQAAYQSLSKYTAARPDDTSAYVKMAEIYDHIASSYPQRRLAVGLLTKAWRTAPQQTHLARRAAELALEIEEFTDAIQICRQALKDQPSSEDRAPLVRLLADALRAEMAWDSAQTDATWSDVRQAMIDSVALPKYPIRHAALLAQLLRDPQRLAADELDPERANGLIRQLVETYPDSSAAWLAQYRYRRRFVEEDAAAWHSSVTEDLERALELGRREGSTSAANVLATAADESLRAGDSSQSEEYLREAIELAPQDPRAYVELAELLSREGTSASLADAAKVLSSAIEARPGADVALILPLATLLARNGRLAEAVGYLEPLEAILPRVAGKRRGTIKLGLGLVRAEIDSRDAGPRQALQRLDQLLADSEVQLVQQQAPAMLAEAWALRGRLLLSLDSVDKAADAFRRAAQIAPESPQIIEQLAVAATSVDDWGTAERAYLALIDLRPGDASAQRALAGIEIRKQLRFDLNHRNWRRAEAAVKTSAQADPSSPTLYLLEAELSGAKGNLAEAEQTLRKGVQIFPDRLELWRGLAVNLGRQGNFPAALEAVRRYRRELGESVAAAALEADLQVQSGDREGGMATLVRVWELATEKGGRVPAAAPAPGAAPAGAIGDQAAEAGLALARLQFQLGETDASFATLEAAQRLAPQSLRVVESAAQSAAAIEDFDRLEGYEQLLRRIEGDDGSQWRAYRALRLLAQATRTSDPGFREATQLVDRLQQIRPRWAQTHFLRGEIARRLDHVGAATLAYEAAWDMGGRNMQVADRLIELLTLQGRQEDAAHYVQQIRGFLSLSARLFDRAVPYFAQGQQRDEALRLAEQWVERRPDDPFTHIRLGRVLTIMADADADPDAAKKFLSRASSEFQHAVRLHPADVRPWVAAVMFFAQYENDRQQAFEIMQQLSNQPDIDLLQRAYILAQLSESLQQTADAQHFYQEAVSLAQEKPDSELAPTVLGRAALFYVRNVPRIAEIYARQALERDPHSANARQALVEVLARRGTRESVEEAFRLFNDEQQSPDAELSNNRRRLLAALLLQAGRPEEVARAARLMEEVLQPTRDDRALLARLYLRSGRIGSAFDLLSDLALAPEPRGQDLVEFLLFWQNHFVARTTDQNQESDSDSDAEAGAERQSDGELRFARRAEQVYRQLAGLPGEAGQALRLRLRQDRILAPGSRLEPEQVNQRVASVFADLPSRYKDAAQRGVELRHRLYQAMGVLLADGEPRAALDLAVEPPQGLAREEAIVHLLHALTVTPHPAFAEGPLREQLDGLVERLDYAADVLQASGDYAFMQRRYADAVAAYRRVIERDPDRILAVNNCILALAEQPTRRVEASDLLAEALLDHPADLRLVDTQAVLALLDEEPQRALELLREVDRRYQADPITYLHMAIAHQALQDEQAAGQMLLRSLAMGAGQQVLSPRDRDFLNNAQRELLPRVEFALTADR